MNKYLLQNIIEAFQDEKKIVLATIIKVAGSVPRHEGAQMLIFEDLSVIGTIGGGCGEASVKMEALNVIDTNEAKTHRVLLNNDIAAKEGMVCGGMMDVYLEPLKNIIPYQKALSLLQNNQSSVMLERIGSPNLKSIYNSSGELLFGLPVQECLKDYINSKKPLVLLLNNENWLVQPIQPDEKLLILGAGHVGKAVADYAYALDFAVSVVDDRSTFANKQRFPLAKNVICADFVSALAESEIDDNTYVVIVTRGHSYDEICLKYILTRETKYVGMIGSKRRVELLRKKILAEGIVAINEAKLHAPIGLKIGAETPEEIAISVLAEIISVRRSS
ncbi:MAG: XdhC/CoxI family protein [Clostridia bacterium]